MLPVSLRTSTRRCLDREDPGVCGMSWGRGSAPGQPQVTRVPRPTLCTLLGREDHPMIIL